VKIRSSAARIAATVCSTRLAEGRVLGERLGAVVAVIGATVEGLADEPVRPSGAGDGQQVAVPSSRRVLVALSVLAALAGRTGLRH
jgi:hypothetical protein